MNLPIRLIWLLCLLASPALAQDPFRVELGRDGETIGDMRPVFLKFEARPLPDISPAEVARRYRALFQSSDEPEVRVDALNRLSNLRDRSGRDIGYSIEDEQRIYQEVLGSYESILARGSFSGRLDELLYQIAKAHALTGQSEESIERLKQLVGLYPKSGLVPEARFRMAEAAFAHGHYEEAEVHYQALLESGEGGGLQAKARYMLGWSQFKQGDAAWDRAGQTFLAVLDEFLPTVDSLARIAPSSVDTIDDTFRVLAIMAARRDGPATLAEWLEGTPSRPWAYLLFDRLADFFAVNGDVEASVATNLYFVHYQPEHPHIPLFLAQVVSVWEQAGHQARIREAKASYLARFAGDPEYSRLTSTEQSRWRTYARELAEVHYRQGTSLLEANPQGAGQAAFARAASYYESLAARVDDAGPEFRLAGDARLQAGDYTAALANFRQSAYQTDDHAEGADAGWAGLVLLRDGLDGTLNGPGFRPDLSTLSDETDRFRSRYGDDARLPGLLADLASRWLSAGQLEAALGYASAAASHGLSSTRERYVAWQVVAEARQQQGDYALAERAWQQVLQVTDSAGNGPEIRDAVTQQLATAIYRQGERAASQGQVATAVRHFQRIEPVLPNSELAISGRFDAANTLLKASELPTAIRELERFRRDFPGHRLSDRISDKLVHAYAESGQPLRAADELLTQADTAAEPWPLRLRAAELFHQAEAWPRRNPIYSSYLATGPQVADADHHVQLQTFRHRLIEAGVDEQRLRAELVRSELASPFHSQQTLTWAARSSLALGARAAASFSVIALTAPLDAALERKHKALELARQRFLDAEQLVGEQVRSESLYRRAELYRIMAQDLMASSVPAELNELEAMQYQMLLEEEAFPFEEKAIRLHSENHQRISSQGYDAWIGKSLSALAALNPGRYDRAVRWMSWIPETSDDV